MLQRLPAWRASALMIPDTISTCRVAVPSPRDLLGRPQEPPALGRQGHHEARAYGVLQSHPLVNRVRPLHALHPS